MAHRPMGLTARKFESAKLARRRKTKQPLCPGSDPKIALSIFTKRANGIDRLRRSHHTHPASIPKFLHLSGYNPHPAITTPHGPALARQGGIGDTGHKTGPELRP